MKGPWVVVTGNPVDGLVFYGPFSKSEDAHKWAEDADSDWWLAPLEKP